MTSPGRDGRPRSRAERLSALISAMRDVHGALIELEAREARLFEAVEIFARQEIDELAQEVRDERDPVTPELEEEKLGETAEARRARLMARPDWVMTTDPRP